MPQLIQNPSIIEAAGNKPKIIEEYAGRVNSGHQNVSVARMKSPEGWVEPGQRPEFEELTIVLRGMLRVESEEGTTDVREGQAIVTKPGEWVRYSTPESGEQSISPYVFQHSHRRQFTGMRRENMRREERPSQLQRVVGLPGAVLLGLGSMVGTGVFVSIGLGVIVAGSDVMIAIFLAAIVALCNGLSSAQLAAKHPVSGGTYEYGYRYLNPHLGFLSGWTFLIAKSASAATAALGIAQYLFTSLQVVPTFIPLVALGFVLLYTLITLAGLRRSNQVNAILVALTFVALGTLMFLGSSHIRTDNLPFIKGEVFPTNSLSNILQATALLFVAFTGYGRVATLGEEVHNPRRTVPRSILVVVLITTLLYLGVAFVSVGVLGENEFSYSMVKSSEGILIVVARWMRHPEIIPLLTVGAITAMSGVLLNLILGLSRVLMAMGRRGDMPTRLAQLNKTGKTPVAAVIVVGSIVGGLTLIGDVKTTWSFSAFAVLIYYGITNLSALQLLRVDSLYPRIVPAVGLLSCLALAFFLEREIWLIGLGLIAVGVLWQQLMKRKR